MTDQERTELERELMRHALGLDWQKRPYRNSYYTERAGTDAAVWEGLVQRDLASRHQGWEPDMVYYRCTYPGAKLAYGKPLSEKHFKEL